MEVFLMTTELEFEGKNVERALLQAAEKLNLSVDQISYEILNHGSTGLFGLMNRKKARIRVKSTRSFNPLVSVKETLNQIAEESLGKEYARRTQPDDVYDSEEDIEDEDDASINGESGSSQINEEITVQAESALRQIVNGITDNSTIQTRTENGRLFFDIRGGNTGMLIGKRGQTLEAIQYLIDKIVNKQSLTRIRVQVDVEGYLNARRENLQKLAERMADRAKRKGRPTTLGQLNAHDRRVIHLTLKDDEGVRTQSIGDGYMRKLVIFPKGYQNRRRRTDGPGKRVNRSS
jgi:spoIIIJ-associated protein